MKSDMSVGEGPDTPVIQFIFNNDPSVSSSQTISHSSDEAFRHARLVLSRWETFLQFFNDGCGRRTVSVNGETLGVASVVAAARYWAPVDVGLDVRQNMTKSYDFMKSRIAGGHTIYGVNTGFGGSANTHTDDVDKLQRNLIKFLNCGIITASIADDPRGQSNSRYGDRPIFSRALPNEDPAASTTMPESWVRAALLIRINSLSCGNSGVRPEVVSSLIQLLNKGVTPVIPLRGSISASGDLIPLSYIAATLQGSPDVEVLTNGALGRERVTAAEALSRSSLPPFKLGPKEGLAMVNGTGVSAGVGSLALHDAHGLAILSQILTAMGVEALRGSAESFDPFLSKVRPHIGQSEVASNIRHFLKGSRLLSDKEEDYVNSDSLRQDRYSIRTAPQWLGPQLEDLLLADEQMSIEINSTTDNPIINLENQDILHGGNFQAMSVTSAMDKTRSALHSIGRLLFAQSTELINPLFNNGLPPNLTVDEPSQSFLFKGIDISIASYQAELGFLSAPVTPHVQNAEMGNQSVNSLALLSARHTHTALNILSQLSAAYLLTLCQAFDLREIHVRFLSILEPQFAKITNELFESRMTDIDILQEALWLQLKQACAKTTAIDSSQRFVQIMQTLQPSIFAHAIAHSREDTGFVSTVARWTERCSSLSLEIFRSTRSNYSIEPDASQLLGSASKKMYRFVRTQLGIPFLTAALEKGRSESISGPDIPSLGALVSRIHCAIQNGALYVPMTECLREVEDSISRAADSLPGHCVKEPVR